MAFFRCLHALFERLTGTTYAWPGVDISLPNGRHLHLVGSIHMGTQDMAPLPSKLLQKLQRADSLIVEADISVGGSPFAHIPAEMPLNSRLDPDSLQQIIALCEELGLSYQALDTLPLWQVALMLQAQQAQRLGLQGNYGIDYQLLQAAKTFNKPIQELEGADCQVSLLTSLPLGGRALLQDTLIHWHLNARLLQTMISWWLSSPPAHSEVLLPDTYSGEMHQRLIEQRNQQWCKLLSQLPAGRYVVAVGALHLYGEDSLPTLLKAQHYRA